MLGAPEKVAYNFKTLEYYSYKKMFDYSEDFRNLNIFPKIILECQLKLEIFRESGSPQSNRKIFL